MSDPDSPSTLSIINYAQIGITLLYSLTSLILCTMISYKSLLKNKLSHSQELYLKDSSILEYKEAKRRLDEHEDEDLEEEEEEYEEEEESEEGNAYLGIVYYG